MTREEAIQVLHHIVQVADTSDCGIKEIDGIDEEALDMAIKALEQVDESVDAISRQAVIDKLNRMIEVERLQGTDEMNYGRERVRAYETMLYLVKSEYLYPSVNPQEPTGHWEWLTEDKYRCSNCNSETRVDECLNEPMYEFCPFCGARMESEG